MKQGKKAVKICLACLLFILLTGCQKEKTVQEQQIPVPEEYQLEDPSIPDWKRGTKKKEKKEKKAKPKETFDPMKISKGDLEKNFEEVMKHVTICGKKVSFPLTLKKLGKGFTIKKSSYQPKGNDVMADLYYKGKKVADLWIEDGKKGNIKEKRISIISFSRVIDPDTDFNICGVNFEVSEDYIRELWGENKNVFYSKGGDEKNGCAIGVIVDTEGTLLGIDIIYE